MRSSVRGFMVSTALVLATAGSAIAQYTPQAPPPPPKKVALKGGRIIPVVGEELAKGTILIENGKITAIGADIEVPFDAMEVDCTGKVLFPGMIDPHSARGLDIPNENIPVTPFLNVYDAVDPSKLFFEDSLRDGVTSVHVIVANECVIGGVSRLVRPIGLSVDEMTVEPDVAMKFSTSPKIGFDRMQQLATLREAFAELDDSIGRLAETKYEEQIKKDGKKIDVGPAEAKKRGMALIQDTDYDDRQLNLVRLRRGDMAAWVYCGTASDVSSAVKMATDQKILEKTVFVLGPETYKAVAELKKSKRPVVLDANLFCRERDELSGELKETFIPKKIADAGIAFALQPSPNTSMAERYLNYQAAVCVRNGIPRQAALEAITINPAKFLGMEKRLGSLEVGKTANIVILSGDPLDFSSWVELVYIDGIKAYDRKKDFRIEELLKLEKKIDTRNNEKKAAEAAKAEAAKEGAKPKDDAKPAEKKDDATGKEGDAKPADGAKPAGDAKPADDQARPRRPRRPNPNEGGKPPEKKDAPETPTPPAPPPSTPPTGGNR